jgi:hypothetical protein
MVKMRILILLAVLIVGGNSLGLAQEQATYLTRLPPNVSEGFVAGRLQWAHNSICEYQFRFLSYYIEGCTPQQRIWLYHPDLPPTGTWSGQQIWAEGTLVDIGYCLVLDMQGHPLRPCPSPTGCQIGR